MIDKSALGAVGEPFELIVERGKLDEMARAVRAERSPVPTFLTTIFHWERMCPGANPWHKVGMSEELGMHAEQEYLFHGPPPAEGQPPEPDIVSAERSALVAEKAEINAVLGIAESLSVRVDNLVGKSVA